MKLQAYKTGAFIAQPDKSLCLYLLYGPDTGLVRERGLALAKSFVDDVNDPFAVADIGVEALVADPARLADEMATIPMMGGWRLVRVRDASEAGFAAVDALLEHPPAGRAIAILEAGDLSKSNRLRVRVEDDGRAMALPCYADEGQDLSRSVSTMLREQGFSIAPEALETLTGMLPPDRIGVRLELDKLMTYALKADPKRITLEDVEATLSDGHAESIDEAVWAAASADLPRLDATLARLAAEDTSPVALLRGMQRHLLRLYEVRAHMADGLSMEEAVKQLRPPVFYKRSGAMREQARRWSPAAIHAALHQLVQAEAQCKSSGLPAERLAERALFGLGRLMAR